MKISSLLGVVVLSIVIACGRAGPFLKIKSSTVNTTCKATEFNTSEIQFLTHDNNTGNDQTLTMIINKSSWRCVPNVEVTTILQNGTRSERTYDDGSSSFTAPAGSSLLFKSYCAQIDTTFNDCSGTIDIYLQ